MIIVAIIALCGVVLAALYVALAGLPAMPTEIFAVLTYIAGYLGSGASFVAAVTYWNVIVALFSITVTVEGIVFGYRFIMWVAKKIPMFGVSD